MKKNPSKKYFRNVPLESLRRVFQMGKAEKMRFLGIFGNKLNYFENITL